MNGQLSSIREQYEEHGYLVVHGDAVPGVNEYNPLPRYVGGKHMPFRDQAAWNERVDHFALAKG